MELAGFLAVWVAIGIGVLFVAFSGGPGRARQAYLTGGNRAFRVVIPLLYLAFGAAIPAMIIANRDEAVGGTGTLAGVEASEELERGKGLFLQTCASCHSLAAVNARGVTGPSLDQLGAVDERRVLTAIRIGGTGQRRMPAGLLEGENARAVARFVARTAGR